LASLRVLIDPIDAHQVRHSKVRGRRQGDGLSRHWELIVAADFFTVEVWTRRGLQRFIVLLFIELATRRVEIAGIASTANGLWMSLVRAACEERAMTTGSYFYPASR